MGNTQKIVKVMKPRAPALRYGGNAWLTDSVPPDTKVMMNRPDLIYLKK
jgi:hypothetical protein